MKKLSILLFVISTVLISSCSTGSDLSYNQNTGLSKKKVNVIAKSKSGRTFCKH